VQIYSFGSVINIISVVPNTKVMSLVYQKSAFLAISFLIGFVNGF